MRNYQRLINFPALALWLGVVLIGLIVGFAVGINPVLPGLLLVSSVVLGLFFRNLEQAILSALVMRSAIDGIVSPPLPSAFAIAIDILTILYVLLLLFQKRTVHTDWLWWFLLGWVVFQAMWLVLMPIGGLGLDAAVLGTSLREWVRLFSWVMVYLLIMQLKERTHPQTIINILFWALVIPLAIAFLQMFVPGILPPQFAALSGAGDTLSEGSRIRGSIGHPNSFATFLLLFIGLTTWKLTIAKERWPWLLLLGLLAFFYVSTKALFSLMMLAAFMLVLIAPRLSLLKLIGALFFLSLVIFLFASTEFGQQRLESIGQTPLLNPNIDIWRAILLSYSDHNSFNWRIAQWHELLEAWKQYPLLGYGLGVTTHVASNGLYAHNDYVRALTEGGIIGLVSFIIFFVVQIGRVVELMKRSLTNKAQNSFCLVLLALLLTIPVGMITENIWSHTMLFFYWFTLIAVAGWDWHTKPLSS